MKWGDFMNLLQDRDSIPVGAVVLTPSGRRAIVKKHLSGSSKLDCFDRVICRYEDGPAKDLVTLQPHQLRRLPPAPAPSLAKVEQLQLEFA